nr:transposase [Shewanella algae]
MAPGSVILMRRMCMWPLSCWRCSGNAANTQTCSASSESLPLPGPGRFPQIASRAAQPKGKKAKVTKADMALGFINKLYRIERQINELKEKAAYTPEQVAAYRQQHCAPILDKLKTFLEKIRAKSPRTA